MPHIGAAMEQSLQDSLVDRFRGLVTRSIVAALGERQSLSNSVSNGVTDVKTALSSWDNCMAVTYCKWPLIGVIIFVSLIVFSIVWCCARCLCCGVSCCCSCFQCFKCCGNCCGMCDPPGGRKHKYVDEPYAPQQHHDQAYRAPAPMDYRAPAPMDFPPQSTAPPAPMKRDIPQYATFESDRKGDADSLPAMPLWNDGLSKKVMVAEEVEMEPLKKPIPAETMVAVGAGRTISPRPGLGQAPSAAVSPYGTPQGGRAGYNGYTGAASDPYAQQETGYFNGNEYGQQTAAYGTHQGQEYGVEPVYGSTAGAMATGQQQQYHQQGHDMHAYGNQPTSQAYGQQGYAQSQTPRPYGDEYGRSVTPGGMGRSGTPGSSIKPNGYGRPPPGGYAYDDLSRSNSPSLQGAAAYRASPAPQYGDEYGQQTQEATSYARSPPRRQYTGDSHGQYSTGSSQQQQYGGSSQQQQQYPQPHDQGHNFPAGLSGGEHAYEVDGSAQRPAELYSPTMPEPPRGAAELYSPAPIAPPHRAAELHSEPVSPLHNNSGFDFQSGYSRNSPAPPSQPAGPPAGSGAGYPGQRQYRPHQGGGY
ncbi:DnaJ subfamily C member 5 [Microdochium nivale]|nr:DnaJ subfamily C member 5 [Microdochium nivale]